MLKLEEVIQLKEDEDVRAITRRHGLTLIPSLLGALLLIVGPFFFLFPLFASGPAGIIVFGVFVLAGTIIAIRSFIMWDGDVFIVTNQRIVDVDQKGVFARTVNEIIFENVQDLSWAKHGPIDVLLNIGSLKVQTAGAALTVEAHHIPRPQQLQNLINDLRHATKPKRIDLTPQRVALLKQLTTLIETLDDDSLRQLAGTLKKDDRDITIKRLFGEGPQGLKPMDDAS